MAVARAFVIRPFGKKTDASGRKIDFDRIHEQLIAPALEAADLGGATTGEILDSGNIREDMFALILEADLVVCDVTIHNANVFYELGIRHSLRKKRTLLIRGEPTSDAPPFDILTDRFLSYPLKDPASKRGELEAMLTASLQSDRPTDSPVFLMLPSLPEADPAKGRDVVPLDFQEEVLRAQAAQAGSQTAGRGWLRLLAEDLEDRRFKREGLRLVAKAQFELRDWDAARQSWEAIREVAPDDLDANFALANIYERGYRQSQRPELLEQSDQAIQRALRALSSSGRRRAEVMTLAARNEKTRWRLEFAHLPSVEERRSAAVNKLLLRAYQGYRKAYLEDLNHYWSGLAALQMGVVLLDLSALAAWSSLFANDRAAQAFKDDLQAEVQALRGQVALALEGALQRRDAADPEGFWVEITAADLQFVAAEPQESRLVRSYRDAIPKDKPFAWDSARGQLELFRDLGIRADLASAVIAAVEARQAKATAKPAKPVHLLLVVGHRIDSDDRRTPRFPAAQEPRARELLREAMKGVVEADYDHVVLASGAAGWDILGHEVAAEFGLPSILCLPFPAKTYAGESFGGLDGWKARFLNLLDRGNALELSDRVGLPRWLHGSKNNPWERGNRWVLRAAQAWGAPRVTLIALWDGKSRGDAPGGTAQIVELARRAPEIRVIHVDSRQLVRAAGKREGRSSGSRRRAAV
jgi:hypothetical protein